MAAGRAMRLIGRSNQFQSWNRVDLSGRTTCARCGPGYAGDCQKCGS